MPDTVTKLAIADAKSELEALLRKLAESAQVGNSVVATVGDCYVQWCSDQRAISVEAVSNERLPAGHKLDDSAAKRLCELGFLEPDAEHVNYHKHVTDHARLQGLAEEGIVLLQQIYGVESTAIVELQASYVEVWKPSNPALSAALERQAERDDTRARSDVFFAFLAATLLLPTEDTGDVSLLRSETGAPTLAVFTDTEALERLWPDGKSFTLMTSGELFPWVRDHQIEHLLVNPGGPVVCQLNRDQIGALVLAAEETRTAVSG